MKKGIRENILKLNKKGLTAKEIAKKLGIKVRLVNYHKKRAGISVRDKQKQSRAGIKGAMVKKILKDSQEHYERGINILNEVQSCISDTRAIREIAKKVLEKNVNRETRKYLELVLRSNESLGSQLERYIEFMKEFQFVRLVEAIYDAIKKTIDGLDPEVKLRAINAFRESFRDNGLPPLPFGRLGAPGEGRTIPEKEQGEPRATGPDQEQEFGAVTID